MQIIYYDGTTEIFNTLEFGAGGRTVIIDGTKVVDTVTIIRIVPIDCWIL